MILRLLNPGIDARLVSAARPGRRGLGVGPGGPADAPAWEIANAIVGHFPPSPALELMSGTALLLEGEEPCRLALFGSPMSMTVGMQEVFAGRSFLLRPGETLKIGGSPWGMRAYLAAEGGLFPADGDCFRVRPAGGEPGRLERGVRGETSGWLFDESPESIDLLRVVDGPQSDWFAPDALTAPAWKISTQMSRMGVRLEGTPLERPTRELLSEMVLPGTVQVTGEGLPIVLGVDAQTIGGYPKVAQVIGADLWKIAQLRPNRTLRFVRVNVAQAEQIADAQRAKLHEWRVRLMARG